MSDDSLVIASFLFVEHSPTCISVFFLLGGWVKEKGMKSQVAYLLWIPESVTPVNIVLHVSPFLSRLCEEKGGESPV